MPIPDLPDRPVPGQPNFRAVAIVIGRIEREIQMIAARLGSAAGQIERIGLKAEQVHLQKILKQLRRKPPEAGLPVPAVPPRGPLPLQGGAEAPLEFD